eukprot:COSAG02_NODE_24622_length_682_cov_1.056604_1_plen_88_part_01
MGVEFLQLLTAVAACSELHYEGPEGQSVPTEVLTGWGQYRSSLHARLASESAAPVPAGVRRSPSMLQRLPLRRLGPWLHTRLTTLHQP